MSPGEDGSPVSLRRRTVSELRHLPLGPPIGREARDQQAATSPDEGKKSKRIAAAKDQMPGDVRENEGNTGPGQNEPERLSVLTPAGSKQPQVKRREDRDRQVQECAGANDTGRDKRGHHQWVTRTHNADRYRRGLHCARRGSNPEASQKSLHWPYSPVDTNGRTCVSPSKIVSIGARPTAPSALDVKSVHSQFTPSRQKAPTQSGSGPD